MASAEVSMLTRRTMWTISRMEMTYRSFSASVPVGGLENAVKVFMLTVKIGVKLPSNITPLKIATNFHITPLKVKCLEWSKNAFYTGRKCFLMKIKFSK